MGIPGLIAKSISQCSIDIRKVLWKNVIVSGGVSMTTGFVERLARELETCRNQSGLRTNLPPPLYTNLPKMDPIRLAQTGIGKIIAAR